ncbi:MAG: hypothetical protein IPL46_04720 [Saprospiraceae bacterium]|nr:hypothetical protein [Saprospiraceae bacterium]
MIDVISSQTIEYRKEKRREKMGFVARYDAFCKRQESEGLLWYLIPLMTLPTIIMPISTIAMSFLTGYIAFVGVSILLFFANIIVTIAGLSQKTVISTYLFTVLFHIMAPLFIFGFLVITK